MLKALFSKFSSKAKLSLKKQQRKMKIVEMKEKKKEGNVHAEDCKQSGVKLRKVHPARDVDECASGFKLALQPPAVWIPH